MKNNLIIKVKKKNEGKKKESCQWYGFLNCRMYRDSSWFLAKLDGLVGVISKKEECDNDYADNIWTWTCESGRSASKKNGCNCWKLCSSSINIFFYYKEDRTFFFLFRRLIVLGVQLVPQASHDVKCLVSLFSSFWPVTLPNGL